MLTNFKSPTECTEFCRFLTIYHPFYGSRLYFGKSQGYLWIKMPQNVKKSSIWSPFLARGIEWRCFEVDEFFQGLLPVPFLCEKCPLRYLFFAWTSWSILVPSLRAFGQEIWNGLKLYSQSSTVFQKNAIKMKMLFSIQPNDLGFWCIQLMHSNFEFSDAPDPKCLGAPRALLVFWSKKILSETDFVLVSVWQFKLGELEIASLKDHLNYPWIGFSLPVEKWLQSWFKLNSMISFVLAYAWLRLRLS